jgi:hypothetical protein
MALKFLFTTPTDGSNVLAGASNSTMNGTHPLAAFFYALHNPMPGVDEYKTRKGNKSAVFIDCLKRLASTILLMLFFIQKTMRSIMSKSALHCHTAQIIKFESSDTKKNKISHRKSESFICEVVPLHKPASILKKHCNLIKLFMEVGLSQNEALNIVINNIKNTK